MIIGIVAVDENNGIGKNDRLPWSCPEDLHNFKKVTMGGNILMGRKTWESLPKRPLPYRNNIVLTNQTHYQADKAIVINTPVFDRDVFIIGGAQIYELYAKHIDMWMVSKIVGSYDCDTFFNPAWLDGFVAEGSDIISDKCVMHRYIRNND